MELLIQPLDVCFLRSWLQSCMFLVIFTTEIVTLNLKVTKRLTKVIVTDNYFTFCLFTDCKKVVAFPSDWSVQLRQHWWLWENTFESEKDIKQNKVFVQSSAVPGRYMMESCISWICVWIELYHWIISVDLITL
jgi:hypothetical protein